MRDFRGCTPLHVCSNKPCVKLLLRYWEKIDPLIKTAEGLLPSGHYWKYTEDDDKITEIQTILSKAEEKRVQENARMNRLRQQMLYEESLLADKKYTVTAKEMMKIRSAKQPPPKKDGGDSDSD